MSLTIGDQPGAHRFDQRDRESPRIASAARTHPAPRRAAISAVVGQRAQSSAPRVEGPAPLQLRLRRARRRRSSRPRSHRHRLQRAIDLRQIEDALLFLLEAAGVDHAQRAGGGCARSGRQRDAVRQMEDRVGAVRQPREQLVVHPAASRRRARGRSDRAAPRGRSSSPCRRAGCRRRRGRSRATRRPPDRADRRRRRRRRRAGPRAATRRITACRFSIGSVYSTVVCVSAASACRSAYPCADGCASAPRDS